MAKLPNLSIQERIDAVVIEDYPRPHLGASVIGHPCRRYLVYSFYWAYRRQTPARLQRTFDIGNLIEDVIIASLKSIGIDVYNTQDKIEDDTGHAGGSIDGICCNVPGFPPTEELLFEAKSMNHANFLDMKRKGLQASKPMHYSQMNMYMGRKSLDFGLYAAFDKDKSDLYIEIIPFDQNEYWDLNRTEQSVLFATDIGDFPRIGKNASWYQCKYCDAKGVCHSGEALEENCRTCESLLLGEEGKVYCGKTKESLSLYEQENGCNKYKQHEMWLNN